jgi:LmbE family N-acetylglucosaminyl deacetylase
MKRDSNSWVYLSPHLDDVVLSCGSRVRIGNEEGRKQRIITLFAGAPNIPALPSFFDVSARRAEDLAALHSLGIHAKNVVHLEFLDAIFRQSKAGRRLYSPKRLFGQLALVDRNWVPALTRALRKLLPRKNRALLFAPFAVGGHVDHQLTYLAARNLEKAGYLVRYYEDLPYACDSAILRKRLSLHPGWVGEAMLFGASDMRQKLHAVAKYKSQVPLLFGTAKRMHSVLKEQASRVAGDLSNYAERVWFFPASYDQ